MSFLFYQLHFLFASADWAFYNCEALTGSLTIPNSVLTIGEYPFANCKCLTSINIPENLTILESWVFGITNLTSISIPNSVTEIKDYTFVTCTDLTSLTIPEGVIEIGGSAFRGCWNLPSIIIPNTVTDLLKVMLLPIAVL